MPSNDWKSKLITYDKVGKYIKSGDVMGSNFGLGIWSKEWVHAVMETIPNLDCITLMDSMQLDPSIEFYKEEYLKKTRGKVFWHPVFSSGFTRPMFEKCYADIFTAMGTDAGTKQGRVCDVWVCPVTPPNRHGYVNFGPTGSWSLDAIREGKKTGKMRLLVGEINDQMGVVYGDNWCHVSEFDLFLENSHPVQAFGRAKPGEIEERIAANLLSLINDGDCFQMGIGSIPEAVVSHLDQKNDLSCHSEMVPTGLNELVAKGIVTNKRKPFHQGFTCSAFSLGSPELYDFITENPAVQIFPMSYVNNPTLVRQIPNFIAINMGLLVDLSGQIASEGLGHRQISNVAGQFDFQMGAFWSPGGKAITVLTSGRHKNGNFISSIVPELPAGTPVSVPRHYADYIVTEWGIAHVRDLTRTQRAEALIEVAHPEARDMLKEGLKKNFRCPEDYCLY